MHALNHEKEPKLRLLSQEQLKALLAAIKNPRDLALVCVLIEGALKPAELLSLRVGSVKFRKSYCMITVNGKGGVRRLPLVASFKPLLEWLEKHPERHNSQAPLWLTEKAKCRAVSYPYLRKIIKKAAEEAGISKRVWPYLLRYTTLVSLAKCMPGWVLRCFAGLTDISHIVRHCAMIDAKDLEDIILELHGLKKRETWKIHV